MMENFGFDNSMYRQAVLTPGFVKTMCKNISDKVLMDALPIKELYDAQKIVITGCGDSYLAGLAAKPAFESIAKMDVEVHRCVEFSRFFGSKALGYSPNTPLVIGISISGSVSRVVEALTRADKHGANTIAITNNPESAVAKAARHVICLNMPEGEYQPGLNSYVASTLALMLLAIRFGVAKNLISVKEKNDMIAAICDHADAYEAALEEMNKHAYEMAGKFKDLRCLDFIGDYADYATAFFGSAKVIECYGGYTTYDDSEDWCHINFFLRDPATIGRVAITNEDTPSYDRMLVTLEAVRKLTSPCMVVTNADKKDFPEEFEVFTTPKAKYFWITPLMQHLPFDLVAGYIAGMKGITFFRRDEPAFLKVKNTPYGDGRIRGSQIEII